MKRELTDEERERMGLKNFSEPTGANRGWTAEQVKQAIHDKGLSIAEFERQADLSNRSVRDAMKQRSPKTDKMIAAFLNVHESIIWPNRYFVSGVSIPKNLNVENQTDEWLAEYNAKIKPVTHIKIIDSWTGGPDGGPIVRYQELQPKRETVTDKVQQTKNADGTVNHPWYDQPVAPDVPAAADQHFVECSVSLPPGMKLDEKP